MPTAIHLKELPFFVCFSLLISLSLIACDNVSKATANSASCKTEKLDFDLSLLDENGRVGPKDGKTTLDYEFCIPNNEESKALVLGINRLLQVQEGKGRVACAKGELLCLGNTGTKEFKNELCALSQLDLVTRIERTYWE